MPVYFNGTSVTDPYFNGTRIDYIYFNGTLVYQRSTPYYAIQNGYKQSGAPNAWAWSSGLSHKNGDGLIANGPTSYPNTAFYGGAGHYGSEENPAWGADTNTISTNNCKYLTIDVMSFQWGSDPYVGPLFTVYGNGTVIKSEYINHDAQLVSYNFDISAYSNVRARIELSGVDADCWVNVGFVNVHIHN